MQLISYQKFNEIYQESVRDIYAFWNPEMQGEIALHCHGWSCEKFDFEKYLRSSSIRYYKAFCSSFASAGNTVCDIGGFWGVWPLTLKAFGYDVTMTEALKYYSNSFNKLFDFIAGRGVKILDFDPFQPGFRSDLKFDFVTVMAVLEHYPHSPKDFLTNVISLLRTDSTIYIEVPNIAYLPKRLNLIRGRTPLVPISDIYRSEIPFIGHHHEFTMTELRSIAGLSGLNILGEHYLNYSQSGIKHLIHHPIESVMYFLFPSTRECLAITCRKVERPV